jgi:DNA repair protein SbcC/Rad50
LSEQLAALHKQNSAVEAARPDVPRLEAQIESALAAHREVEAHLAQRAQLEVGLASARQRQADARAENPRLRSEMDELKERIDQLSLAEGADCPLCGQPLSPEERESLIDELSVRGREMGDRYRSNQALMSESDALVKDLEAGIASLSRAEADLRVHQREIDQLSARRDAIALAIEEWERGDALRLVEIQSQLEAEAFAPEARRRLAEIDAELKQIGYDAAAHDLVRQAEAGGRSAGEELRRLENARAALAPLEREIAELNLQSARDREELDRQVEEHGRAAAALAEAEAQAPDLLAAEKELFELKEQENRLRLEMGAAAKKCSYWRT